MGSSGSRLQSLSTCLTTPQFLLCRDRVAKFKSGVLYQAASGQLKTRWLCSDYHQPFFSQRNKKATSATEDALMRGDLPNPVALQRTGISGRPIFFLISRYFAALNGRIKRRPVQLRSLDALKLQRRIPHASADRQHQQQRWLESNIDPKVHL